MIESQRLQLLSLSTDDIHILTHTFKGSAALKFIDTQPEQRMFIKIIILLLLCFQMPTRIWSPCDLNELYFYVFLLTINTHSLSSEDQTTAILFRLCLAGGKGLPHFRIQLFVAFPDWSQRLPVHYVCWLVLLLF